MSAEAVVAAQPQPAIRRSWRIVLVVVGALVLRGVLVPMLFRLAPAGVSKEASTLFAMAADGAVMVALAWIAMRLLDLKTSTVLPTAWPREATRAVLGLGIALPLANYVIVTFFFPSAANSSSITDAYMSAKGSAAGLCLGIGLALFAPVVEEIYGRGLLQNALEELSSVAGFLIATLLFILEHPGSLTSPAMWILGLALGLLYHYTRSVAATVACHAINNTVALVVIPLLKQA